MKQVFKYPLEIETPQSIKLPKGYEILTVQSQFNKPMLWALVDNSQPVIDVEIYTYGTGHEMPDNLKYISTYPVDNGNYVFHVFTNK